MPASRRRSTPARRGSSAATIASTVSTKSRSGSARARAALPAVTPRLTREPRDDRAAHESSPAVAAEQVDAQRDVADRQLDAGGLPGKLARLAHLVVAARVGALADPELPGRDLRLGAPDERRLAVAANV